MKTVSVIVLVMCLALAGCARSNSIRVQNEALDSAYARGELTASEYYARKNELIAIDAHRRAAIASALIQSDWTPKSQAPQSVYVYPGQSIR